MGLTKWRREQCEDRFHKDLIMAEHMLLPTDSDGMVLPEYRERAAELTRIIKRRGDKHVG